LVRPRLVDPDPLQARHEEVGHPVRPGRRLGLPSGDPLDVRHALGAAGREKQPVERITLRHRIRCA
jgi:hypothetical protein